MKYILTCLLIACFNFNGTIKADALSDLFSMGAEVNQEKEDDAAAVAQEQSFYGSSGYLTVISTMKSSGVMKNFTSMLETFKSGTDVDETEMDQVVADLTTLFTSMLSAYSDSQMPVMATSSNDAYRFYSTIVMLYCARLQYLGTEIISLVKGGEDYIDMLTTLLDAFSEYETSLKGLTAKFPTASSSSQLQSYYQTLPTLAMNDYYNQAADIVLTDLLSAMQLVNTVTSGLYDQATWAIEMYNALIPVTALQVAPSAYSDFASYKIDLLTTIYSVCKNGLAEVSKAITFVSGTDDEHTQNQTHFNNEYQLYLDACAIFKDQSDLSSQYKQLLTGSVDAANKLNAFNDAYSKMDGLQTLYDQSVSSAETLETSSELSELSSSLGSAIGGCAAIQADLTLIGDNVELTTLVTLYNNLSTIYYVVNMKWLWSLFTTNSSYNGSQLKTLCSSLSSMDDDQFATNFTMLSTIMKSLNSISVSTSNSLSFYLSGAITWSKADSTAVSTSTDNVNFFSSSELNNVQTLISELGDYSSYFVKIYNALQEVNPQQLSSLRSSAGEALYLAQKIDTLYSTHESLDDYISNLAVLSMPENKQTFVDMTVELVLYVLGNLAGKLEEKAVASSDDREKYLESAIVCYALLQSYSSHLSVSDESYVVGKLQTLGGEVTVSIADQAKAMVTDAQSQDWAAVENWMQNESWLSGLQLYQLAYEIAVSSSSNDAAAILVAYDNSIQDYVTQYKLNVAAADQQPLDLFYLYCLLMMNYNGSGDSADLQAIAQDIVGLFQNDAKTGFFDQLSVSLADFQSETDAGKLSERKQEVEDLVAAFKDQMNAESGWLTGSQLMFNQTMNSMLSVTPSGDGSVSTFSFAFDKTTATVDVPELDQVFTERVEAVADQSMSDGKAASDKNDFATAYQKYNDAVTEYAMIINQTKAEDTVVSKYYTARTLAEACLMASTVLRGDVQTVAGIPNVALTYLLAVYNNWTVPTIISNNLGDEYTGSSSWTNEQIQTVVRMMALNSELVSRGYTYDELYTPGTFVEVTLSSSSDAAVRDQMSAKIDSFMSIVKTAMSTGVQVDGVAQVMTVDVVIDASKNITLNCKNMPIAPLTPYYGSGPFAEAYFAEALLLFQPGTDNVTVSSSVYVPGNDATATQNMRLYIAASALANAEMYLQEINDYMAAFPDKIAATTDDAKALLVSDFGVEVGDKYNSIMSILLNSSTGSVAYYNQNNESDYANDAQAYAMKLYSDYEKTVAGLLTGSNALTNNPTSSVYSSILNKLNLAYQVQIALTTDATLIAELNDKVAQIFKDAGDACSVYKTIDASTGVSVHYYKDAATYYNAAVTKYTSNGNTDKANEAEILEYKSYAQTGLQYIANFFYVKTVGESYTDMSGNSVPVNFQQLQDDYAAFTNQSSLANTSSMDANELTLYNNVVSMFLEGIINLNLASNGPTSTSTPAVEAAPATTDDDSSDDDSDAPTYDTDPADWGSINPDVVSFLQVNNASLLTVTQHSFDPPPSEDDSDDASDGLDSAQDAVDGMKGVDTSKGGSSILDALEKGKNDATNAIDSVKFPVDTSDSDDTPAVPDPINIYTLDTSDDSVNEQLLAAPEKSSNPLSIKGVNQFAAAQQKDALSAWLGKLYTSATYVYIQYFLGGIVGATSSERTEDYADKLQTLGQLIEAEGVKMQNPADVYMG